MEKHEALKKEKESKEIDYGYTTQVIYDAWVAYDTKTKVKATERLQTFNAGWNAAIHHVMKTIQPQNTTEK
jgi:hypothetical protein